MGTSECDQPWYVNIKVPRLSLTLHEAVFRDDHSPSPRPVGRHSSRVVNDDDDDESSDSVRSTQVRSLVYRAVSVMRY
jgi:hypothetical protein